MEKKLANRGDIFRRCDFILIQRFSYFFFSRNDYIISAWAKLVNALKWNNFKVS